MATAHNGSVELHYEIFGDRADPTLLLVNGLGSQCINYAEDWCEMFAATGHSVIRFDNRDVGLSTKMVGVTYTLADMAGDCLAVLDAAGIDSAHVMGLSMGGMIVQRLAIGHPDRVRTMTSVMSTTGERGYGTASPEAQAALLATPSDRDESIEQSLHALRVYGSKPEWIDEDRERARFARAYDRCHHPEGVGRQLQAVLADGSRADALRTLRVPTLVLHGSRDTLIDPSGGRRTAELVPGSRYIEIEGMGHDYPPAVWPTWVGHWSDFVATA